MKKIFLFIIVVVLILSISSVALADYQYYNGKMYNSFWSGGLTKINDKEVVDNNSTSYRTNTTTEAVYTSSCWTGKTTRFTSYHVQSSGDRWWEWDNATGTINLWFENDNAYQIHIIGGFWLYPDGTN